MVVTSKSLGHIITTVFSKLTNWSICHNEDEVCSTWVLAGIGGTITALLFVAVLVCINFTFTTRKYPMWNFVSFTIHQ